MNFYCSMHQFWNKSKNCFLPHLCNRSVGHLEFCTLRGRPFFGMQNEVEILGFFVFACFPSEIFFQIYPLVFVTPSGFKFKLLCPSALLNRQAGEITIFHKWTHPLMTLQTTVTERLVKLWVSIKNSFLGTPKVDEKQYRKKKEGERK